MPGADLEKRPSYPPVPLEQRRRESEALIPRTFRSARRNRHLTVPLAVPPAFWGAGEILHAFAVAPETAAAGSMAAAAVWFFAPHKWDRRPEVWYARASAASAAAWLPLTAAFGASSGLPGMLLGGTLAAGSAAWGVPYWRHRRPRGTRRRQRMIARWDTWWQSHAPAWNLGGSRVIDAHEAGVTIRLRVQLWAGRQSVQHVRQSVHLIESALEGAVETGRVRVEGVKRNPSQADLFFKRENPLAQAVEWDPALAPRSVHGKAVDGLSETGEWVFTPMRINAFVIGRTRSGKALSLDTLVPTPAGWTTMGELREGDIVFAADGRPCRVTDAWAVRHGRPCYEMEFSDGSRIVADTDHQWLVETNASRRSESNARHRAGRPRTSHAQEHKRIRPCVATTGAMAGSVTVGGRTNYSVQVAAALAGPEAELPVPPYTLGAWLGDGASATGSITNPDAEVVSEMEAEGELVHVVPCTGRETSPNWRVDGLTTRLRALGLLMNKHIPLAYLRASEDQRRALLAGLLDTDGYCTEQGGAEYCSTSERLARNVHHLAATLGYKPTLRSKPARLNGKDCGTAWTVAFTTTDKVFRLPRKAARLVLTESPVNRRRFITAIRPVPSVPVRCIAVDSPDHLFLVGETCIPTHNSNHLKLRIAQLTGCPDDRQVVIDLKGGRSGRPMVEAAAVDYVITDVDEARMYLLMLTAEITARAKNCYTGEEQLEATAEVPAVHTLIDETRGLTSTEGGGDAACARYLATIASQGSGLEVYVEVFTQYGSLSESVGTEQTRSNLQVRTVYAVEEAKHGAFAIPEYDRFDASRLEEKGTHLLKQGPKAHAEQIRAPLMSDGLLKSVTAANARRLAPRPPWILYCGSEPCPLGGTWQEWWDRRWLRLDPLFRRVSPQYAEAAGRYGEPGMPRGYAEAGVVLAGAPRVTIAAAPAAHGEGDGASVAARIEAETAGPDIPPPDRRTRARLAAAMSSGPEMFADALAAAAGGISPGQLAAESGMGKTWVHGRLNALVERGAVVQPGGRRGVYVPVAGKDLHRELAAVDAGCESLLRSAARTVRLHSVS